jgi:hypothetical protein
LKFGGKIFVKKNWEAKLKIKNKKFRDIILIFKFFFKKNMTTWGQSSNVSPPLMALLSCILGFLKSGGD